MNIIEHLKSEINRKNTALQLFNKVYVETQHPPTVIEEASVMLAIKEALVDKDAPVVAPQSAGADHTAAKLCAEGWAHRDAHKPFTVADFSAGNLARAYLDCTTTLSANAAEIATWRKVAKLHADNFNHASDGLKRAQAESAKLRAAYQKLRAIAHAAFHMLDDSEHDMTAGTITVSQEGYTATCEAFNALTGTEDGDVHEALDKLDTLLSSPPKRECVAYPRRRPSGAAERNSLTEAGDRWTGGGDREGVERPKTGNDS